MAEQETSLSVGSRGEVVKELQQWLNQFAGASIKEDGKYGRETSQAVSNFQRESGIEEDGIAGVNTIESIISYEGEGNEDEGSSEENVQGAEEEVTPQAQEEPEEEVTPEEEAEFEEPTQAPVAPEQDTTPEVTPEEEAEFAAPEGEDPTLSQQPQDTTVSQEPVPAGQVGDQQADPALQPEQPEQPSPEDLATAARYASYANRPTPQPEPAQGQPAPGPVPPEIPQATQKIQQQTAGNYQKFHKPRQPSTVPATNTITPADFSQEVSPEANNSQPQAQASTDPATNTIAPEEVPLQGYSSRDQFRNDLSQSFLTLKNMINSNSKDGIQELQAQLANIQQRAQASGQDFPKLTKYLSDLQGHAQKWGATFESKQPTHRPILTEDKRELRAKRKQMAAEIMQELQDPNNYVPSVGEVQNFVQPTTEEPYDFDSDYDQQPDLGNIAIEWTGPSMKYLTKLHKTAIMAKNGELWYQRQHLYDRDKHIKRLEADMKSGDGLKRGRARDALNDLYDIEEWAQKYLDSNGKSIIDEDMYEDLYAEADIPFFIEEGQVYKFLGLKDLFKNIEKYISFARRLSKDIPIHTDLIDDWEDGLEEWEDIFSRIGQETQEWQNMNDEAKGEYLAALRAKTKFGLSDEFKLTPQEEQDLKDLTAWEKDFDQRVAQDEQDEETREQEAEDAAENRIANDHELNTDLVADLAVDVQNPTPDASYIAKDEEETELLELAQDHATRVVEFLTTTIEGIGWSEDNAPLDTDPNSKMYAGIGERINNFFANLNKFEESASTEDFAVLEKDFDEIVTLVDDYSTTT